MSEGCGHGVLRRNAVNEWQCDKCDRPFRLVPASEPKARAVVFREDCERCLSERDHGYPSCGYCGKEFVRLQSKSSGSPDDWVMSVAGVLVTLDEWQPGAVRRRDYNAGP